MKAIIFTRVSTETQDLEQQKSVLINEACRLGYSLDDLIFIEKKESAISNTLEQREGVSELVEQLPNADLVLVWELSRLARRADVMYKLRDLFIEQHVQLICMTPPFHLLDSEGRMDPTASLVLSLFTSLAESEMMIKKERMKRGLKAKISQGYYHGGPNPLFGYKPNSEKRLEPDARNAATVREIFELYSTGEWTFRALGRKMRDEGKFNNISINSCLTKVHDIIDNPFYTGQSITYPAIVSVSLYEKAQQATKNHRQAERCANKHEMLLKSLIRSKKTGLCLACLPSNRMYQSTSDECPTLYVPCLKVDEPVYELAVSLHKKFISDKKVRQQRLLEDLKMLDKKFRTATNDVKQCQEKLDRLEERIVIGNISQEKAQALSGRLKRELSECISRQKEYELLARQKGQEMYDDYWNENTGGYANLSYIEKRDIILSTIENIYVTRSEEDTRFVLLEIHSKFHTINHLRIQTRTYYKRTYKKKS